MPLVLFIHGSSASEAAQAFCHAFDKEPASATHLKLYFTFDRDDSRRSSALPMVTSFIAQIIMALDTEWESFSQSLDKRFKTRARFGYWCLYDSLRIFNTLVKKREILCVIKNVDHCEPESREHFLHQIRKTIMLTETNFKLLLTADTTLDMPLDENWVLFDAGPNSNDFNKTHSVSSGAIPVVNGLGDISSNTTRTISLLRGHIDPVQISDTKLTDLVTGITDTSFQDMLVTQLEQGISHLSLQKLIAPNLTKPTTPQSIIQGLLGMVVGSDRLLFQQVMAWVLCALRPLSIQELVTIVAWIQHSELLDEPAREKDYSRRRLSSISSLLWGFLVLRENEVRISHPAVREVLCNRDGREWYSVSERDHAHIARLCLELLKQDKFRLWENKNYSLDVTVEPKPDTFTFNTMYEDRSTIHRYVITYWEEHYRRSPAGDRPRRQVKEFFDEINRPFWQSWAGAKMTISGPLGLKELFPQRSESAVSFLAALNDIEILKDCSVKTATKLSLDNASMALIQAVYFGSEEIIQFVLSFQDTALWESSTAFDKALLVAASYSRSKELRYLVNRASVDHEWDDGILVRLSELGLKNAVGALVDRGRVSHAAIATSLARAAYNGHQELCSMLLDSPVKLHPNNISGLSDAVIGEKHIKLVLEWAIRSPCSVQVVETLHQRGVDVLENGMTLKRACLSGRFAVVEALLEIARRTTTDLAGIIDCLEEVLKQGMGQTATCLLVFMEERKAPISQSFLNRNLELAINSNWEAIARVLLNRGAKVTTEHLVKACDRKPANMPIVKLLVKYGANIQAKSYGMTAISRAAQKGDLECLQYLTHLGADLNEQVFGKYSPLMYAARGGHYSCVCWLLKNSAKIDLRNKYGETALFEAAAATHFDIVEFLLDLGADTSGRGYRGQSLLHLCLPSPAILRKILERYPEVNIKNDDQQTPIHVAIVKQQTDAISILAEFGADIEIEHRDFTPLMIAVYYADLAATQVLLELGADVDHKQKEYGFRALHFATKPEIIAALLQYRPDVDAIDYRGRTALHFVLSSAPDFAAIKYQVNARASINIEDEKGHTPFFSFVYRGSSKSKSNSAQILDYLLSKKANPNQFNQQDGSLLRAACEQGNLTLARKLYAAGAKADIGLGGSSGGLLHAACLGIINDRHAIEMIQFLVDEVKADVNHIGGLYGTALGAACMRRSTSVLDVLLEEYRTDPRLLNWAGRLPVHLATTGPLRRFQQLVGLTYGDSGAKSLADKTGRTLLHWAAQSGNAEILSFALSQDGIDINEPDSDGWTALCWAARGPTIGPADRSKLESPKDWQQLASRQTDIIRYLLYHGAKTSVTVGAPDGDKMWTPRSIAAFHALPGAVVVLLAEEFEGEAMEDPKSPSSLLPLGFWHKRARCDCCQSVSDHFRREHIKVAMGF